MSKTYTLVVERDPESGWLVGDVVELPGCHTQAPDIPTLEANVREAIAVHLETAGAAAGPARMQGGYIVVHRRWTDVRPPIA